MTPVDQSAFEIGSNILRRLGLPEARLIAEDRLRTNAENAAFSHSLIVNSLDGQRVLVTSAWHMPRAPGSFCAAGWQHIIPYPTDYRGGAFWDHIDWNLARNLEERNIGVKEWIGLIAYRVTGRITTIFPIGC